MFVRAYLRASTSGQDANRARSDLQAFAKDHGLKIAKFYPENESGASLKRPKLFELLSDCEPGDILLTESVDRLSRLNADDWDTLKAEINKCKIKVVALDLPTSHQMATEITDEFTGQMFKAINSMMLDMLAAIARKDYDDRRRRQAQGIATAKTRGVYKGRQENEKRNARIVAMLERGDSWNAIIDATGCSRSTLSRLRTRVGKTDQGAPKADG